MLRRRRGLLLMLGLMLLAVTVGVAYANGANDVSKGVATLVGSGTSDLRRALAWGTLCTVAGGMMAAFAAQGLVAVFSGKGLLLREPNGPSVLLAIGTGAAGWLWVATRTGLPVSTTHSLVGGLLGAGIMAQGLAGVRWQAVAAGVALPLALSPLAALALTIAVFPAVRAGFRRFSRYCVCVERDVPAVVPVAGHAAAVAAGGGPLRVLTGEHCPPQVIARAHVTDSAHWLTAGATSFFRGMNDTPKILALGATAAMAVGISPVSLYGLVALAMGAGGYLAGRRVTHTLADTITPIRHDDGFAANFVTSVLVGLASFLALPVSTTHVASGAIAGVGLRKTAVNWRVVRDLALGWFVTLPVAGMIAAAAYVLLVR